METVVANVTAKARKATLNGRSYLVAPATLIVPGVLPGSQGAVLYTPEETARSTPAWNGMPLVGYHPLHNGQFISARDPDVLEKHSLGIVFNAAFSDRLTGDLWFDEDLTAAFDKGLAVEHQIIPRLNAGKPIEVSTGLVLKMVPADEGAVHNSKGYKFVGSDYKPDHVAALPDEKGSCSVKDGCGVFNTTEQKTIWQKLGELVGFKARVVEVTPGPSWIDKPPVVANELSHEQLRDTIQRELKSRFTQADPYCYVCEVYDGYFIYEQGMKSYRLTYSQTQTGVTVSGEPVEVVREINYVPTGNEGEATMNRAQLIDFLVANCDCWKGANDRETLNKLPDDKLAALKGAAEKAKASEVVANAAVKPQTLPDGSTVSWDASKGAWTVTPKPVEVPVAQPVTNAAAVLSADDQETLAFGRAEMQRQKQDMIERLTANAADPAAKVAAQAVYQTMTIKQLTPLMATAPQPTQQQTATPSYWGGAAPPPPPVANAKSDEDNLLPETTIDFEQYASPSLRRNKQATA